MKPRVGDRVHVGTVGETGIVRQIDPPGLRPGIQVDLDRQVHGLMECFAAHFECRVVETREAIAEHEHVG